MTFSAKTLDILGDTTVIAHTPSVLSTVPKDHSEQDEESGRMTQGEMDDFAAQLTAVLLENSQVPHLPSPE